MTDTPPRPGLFELLGRLRRALGRAAAWEAFRLFLRALLTVVLCGVVAAFSGATDRVIVQIELLVFFLATGFLGLRYGFLLFPALKSPHGAAAWLDQALRPEERPALGFRSAVELDRDRGRYSESPELVDAAITSVHEKMGALSVEALVRRQIQPRRQRQVLGIATRVLAVALLALFAPVPLSRAIGAIAKTRSLEDIMRPPPPEPRLGELRITYRYPVYTGRPPRTVKSSTGDLHALPGTEVVIETTSLETPVEATLLFAPAGSDEMDGSRTRGEVEGRTVRATLMVTRSGSYRFRIRTLDGEQQEERRAHTIELELDEPPEVVLEKPDRTPLEVNEQDRLELAFHGRDDFGLQEARLAWRVLGTGREGKVPLTSAGRGKKQFEATAQLELAKLELRPGDRVAYSVELTDNDSVNGPKVGASETKELRIYSQEAHHKDVLALQEKALDELVHLLGDNLENNFHFDPEAKAYEQILTLTDKILERARTTNTLLTQVVFAVRKDPLGRKAVASAFDSARKDLSRDAQHKERALSSAWRLFRMQKAPDRARSKGVSASQERMVGSLERNVVYLADLLNDQRMVDAEALAKQLRQEQQALRQALQEYKTAPSAESRKVLEQAISEIRKRISELTAELSKLRGSIPQEYVNQDALKTSDTSAGMDRMEKMLEEGDLEGAMAELERMLSGTEDMISQIEQGRSELGSREYSKITEMAQKLWKELEELERDQKALAQRTEQHSEALRERMKGRLGDPQEFLERQMKRLAQAAENIERAEPGAHTGEGDNYEQLLRRLDDTGRALQAQDFGSSKDMIERALEALDQLEGDTDRRAEQARRFGDFLGGAEPLERSTKELRKSRPPMAAVQEDIERLMPNPADLLKPNEKKELERLSQAQEKLEQQAGRAQQQLHELGQELPIVGPGTHEILQEAKDAMGQAGDGLSRGDAPGALNFHQQTLDALSRLKDALQKMGQGSKSGPGIPLPFGPPQMGQEDGSGPEGDDPRSDEKVEIPKPEQYQAPAEFREDILEAAKHGTVETYREAVRRYYEEIVK